MVLADRLPESGHVVLACKWTGDRAVERLPGDWGGWRGAAVGEASMARDCMRLGKTGSCE